MPRAIAYHRPDSVEDVVALLDDESHRPESDDAESPEDDEDACPVDSLVGSSSGRAPSPRQRSLC